MSFFVRNIRIFIVIVATTTSTAFGYEDIYSEKDITFITPANMVSSYRDSPNSVTSLDVSDLGYLGIDNFVDAMRLVPGMLVAETHGSSATIGYHGTSVHVPRRMQILYNSNRLYRSGYADLLWQRMPIEITDLERIEVVRGTNITDYGTNAFTSTINMIQKPAALETGATFYVKAATTEEERIAASFNGQLGSSKGYFRISGIKSDGFDQSPQIKTFDDDYKGHSFLYNGEVELSNNLLLDWYLANSEYQYEFPSYDNLTSESAEVQASVGGFSADGPTKENTLSGTIKISGSHSAPSGVSSWNAGLDITQFDRDQKLIFCYPPVLYDPNLAELDAAQNVQIDFSEMNLLIGSALMNGVGSLNKSIISPLEPRQQQLLVNFGQAVQRAGLAAVTADMCANTNQNLAENRYSVFAGFNRSTDSFTYSSDIYLRTDDATSETYLAGNHKRHSYEWSNNLRVRVGDKLVLNVGVMAESNNDIDQAYFSPRASVNFSLNEKNIFRLLAAESKRLPGIHETERLWQYPLHYINGASDYYGRSDAKTFRLSQGGDLDPENLKAFEVGYTFLSESNKTVIDTKYFYEKYTNLISQPFSYLAFVLTNEGAVDINGLELGLSHRLDGVKVGGGFSYIENDTDTLQEKSLYSRLSGSLWSVITLAENVNLGLTYFSSKNQAKNSYDRMDANLNYRIKFSSTELSLDFNIRHFPKEQANFTEYSSTDPFRFGYADRTQYYLKSQLAF